MDPAVEWLEEQYESVKTEYYRHRGEIYIRPMFQEENIFVTGGRVTLENVCSCYDPAYSLEWRQKDHDCQPSEFWDQWVANGDRDAIEEFEDGIVQRGQGGSYRPVAALQSFFDRPRQILGEGSPARQRMLGVDSRQEPGVRDVQPSWQVNEVPPF